LASRPFQEHFKVILKILAKIGNSDIEPLLEPVQTAEKGDAS
jgi:hypothetical protein